MTQKILAAHAGLESVKAGQLIMADLDLVLGNDITSPVAINEFNKNGFEGVFDKNKIALVMDHFVPNKDIKAAQQCKQCRMFAKSFNIKNYFDVGEMGIEHALLPEKGLVAPGDCVIGAGAKVLGGITINENCKIGAGSVVLSDVPANSSVVGIPGRVIKRNGVNVHDLEQDKRSPVWEEIEALKKKITELEKELEERGK